MKQKITLLVAALFAVIMNCSAQDDHLNCGTDLAMAKLFLAHPELKAEYDAAQLQAEQQDALDFQQGYPDHDVSNSRQQPPIYVIPVVFHILHQYGTENISDAQVLDCVRCMNEDYRKMNADNANTVAAFQGISADAEIEFRLANLDPNGVCTNGIDRIYTSLTNSADDNSKLNDWPRNKYLNIWVCKTIGSAGVAAYAYLPASVNNSGMADVDGVLVLNDYVGSIGTSGLSHSHTVSHEVGHYLNLQHCWGSTNQPGVACGNDGVSDTPVTKGWSSCNLSNNDVCTVGVDENVQNFMEYSYCSTMFSTGQRTRMRTALTSNTAQRSNLWTTGNLAATGTSTTSQVVCGPEADFLPFQKVMICAGGSVTFNDISWNGHPTAWNWTFPGGTPGTSTDSIPTITYNTPGVYDVTMNVSNGSGSDTKTRTGIVIVSASTATYNAWQYTEGMESASQFSGDWTFISQSTAGWVRTTSAAFTGSASAKINNFANPPGLLDEMISPSIDMTAIQGPMLTFRVAFARQTTTDADRLRVWASTDCGQTWSLKYLKLGNNLNTHTAGVVTTAFTPSASDWRLETVNLSSVSTSSNVRLMFDFNGAGGNNIYIDDINISGASGISSIEAGVNQFDVYPNPAQDNTLVSFSIEKNQTVNLQVVDMTGRVVADVFHGDLQPGKHEFPIAAETLSSGVYFVRLSTAEGDAVTQKLVVE